VWRCARESKLTVSGAAVKEDLGDFCSVRGDFDDVSVSAAGTAASQRAFSAHCATARVENLDLRIAEAVECYSGAMEERTNRSRAVVRLQLRSDFYWILKHLLSYDGKLPPRTISQGVNRGRFHQRDATYFRPSAEL
jgi:hypothetical protein